MWNFKAATIVLLGTMAASQQDCGCLDVAIVIDDSGSMGGVINSLKNDLSVIIQTGLDVSGGDLLLGLVSFKRTIQVDCALTDDFDKVEDAIQGLTASGGSFGNEVSSEALNFAVTDMAPRGCRVADDSFGKFRDECQKVAILATDEPAGKCAFAFGSPFFISPTNAAIAARDNGVAVSTLWTGNSGTVEAEMMIYPNITGGLFVPVGSGDGAGDIIRQIIEKCGGATFPPTFAPTASPTSAPTASPTSVPTTSPTSTPTASPVSAPTASPTSVPTNSPTSTPTAAPTYATAAPTFATDAPISM